MHYLIIIGIMMLLFGPVRGLGIALGAILAAVMVTHPIHLVWILPLVLFGWTLTSK